MEQLIKDEARVRLWLWRAESVYPVCIDHAGFVRIVDDDVAAEVFTAIAWAHPQIGGDIAFELLSDTGRQITGAGTDALREAQEPMPLPPPAFRFVRQPYAHPQADCHVVQIKTLDSRYVSANERIASSYRRRRTTFSWWSISVYETVTRYHTEPGQQLRMLEPEVAQPDMFILQLMSEDS